MPSRVGSTSASSVSVPVSGAAAHDGAIDACLHGDVDRRSADELVALRGRQRARRVVRGSASAVVGAVSGIAPHVLHHVGPLAGAAVVSGALGTAVFGAAGLLLSAPLLWQLHRRSGGWVLPGAALALFATVFALSTLVVGPAITGADDPPAPVETVDHDVHH